MPSTTLKRRRTEEGMRGKVPKQRKNIKRQRWYHSSSDEEGGALDAPRRAAPVEPVAPVPVEIIVKEDPKPVKPLPKLKAKITAKKVIQPAPTAEDSASSEDGGDDALPDAMDSELDEDEDDSDGDSSDASDGSEMSETSTNNPRKVRKRNDPEAFATSMSRILNTKLTTQKRAEPILSRSRDAQFTHKALADQKLTQKANRQLLAEKRAAMEKGRVKDVLGLENPEVTTAEITAKEKALRRTAQKGVIKLFNAVRAAQVKAEQAEKEAREAGILGMAKREDTVKEMSKQGFLEMITGGQKKKEDSVEA
ncbi:Rrp15p-domain-containing protein [Massariosphaeria phaeospora]|uniref:Rrp15p-domain-containing protein n=1 Tax=Massariosphaeria phaeospora TaxID=100035 RepID=A0A7C8MC60_9PLEO|nr:Rrp15p-domain-containing protein [Massariosphaeria phaeospora]